MIFPKTRPCWMIWEHFIKPNGNVRYLRAIDTTVEMKDVHLIALNRERDHGRFEVEEGLLNHSMCHSTKLAMGDVKRLPLGD